MGSPSSTFDQLKTPPIKVTSESDDYDDIKYALTLMDDLNLVESSSKKSTAQPEPLPCPKPLSPQTEYLSEPSADPAEPQKSSRPASPEPVAPQTRFPSSFAVGKKSATRLAASQAAQTAGKAHHRPGKPGRGAPVVQRKPPSSWNSDSDEEEEEDKSNDEDDDDEEEEDERLKKHRLTLASSSLPNVHLNDKGQLAGYQQPQERNGMLHPQARREAATSMYSTFSHSPDGRPMSHISTHATEMGQFPNPMARREMPAVLREQPAEPAENPGMRPAFSQHGLLNRVMQERQEKSAKSIQEAAHWTGEPLVQVNHKPPPIQSGLLGAIASHERDRKRDGGMGAVLTERARERAMRQRETDEFHRQSMYGMVPGPAGFGGAVYPPNPLLNSAGMVPMMFNPQLVPNHGGIAPNPAAIYEQMLFQQHQLQLQQQHQLQLQQQAMMNGQQVYISPYGYSGMAGGANIGMMGGNVGTLTPGHNGMMASPHQSMYGFPNQSMNFTNTPSNLANNSNAPFISPNSASHNTLSPSSSSGNVNSLNQNQNQRHHNAFHSLNSRHN